MILIGCVSRDGPTAVYQHGDKRVRCEHVRTDEPWDLMTHVRTMVHVHELDRKGRATGRVLMVRTSSFDAAALQAFSIGKGRAIHHC